MAPRIDVNGATRETLQDLVNRYSVLERFANNGDLIKGFTMAVDQYLLRRVKEMPDHPKDTGLMKRSWTIPQEYLQSHSGKMWEVFLENTATVEQQYRLKNGSELYSAGNYIKRGRRGLKFRKLRRYMPYVDDKTRFYSKKVRATRQRIPNLFKQFIDQKILFPLYRTQSLPMIESRQYEIEFNR